MLFKKKESKKTAQERIANMDASVEGQARLAEAQNMQAEIQGGLSDIVREHGYVPDELAYKWLDGLKDQQPHQANLPRYGKETFRYDKSTGRVVRVA